MNKQDPFSLADRLQLIKNDQLNKMIGTVLEKFIGMKALSQLYQSLPVTKTPLTFIEAVFQRMNIHYETQGKLDQKQTAGKPLLIVSNHPFGILDGLMLLHYFLQQRSDVRLMANTFVKRIPELSDVMLGVMPFADKQSIQRNTSSMKQSLDWMKQGGCLIVLPGGNVSRFRINKGRIEEAAWNSTIFRMAKIAEADILPVFLSGRNRKRFYLPGLFGEQMHSLLYASEFLHKRDQVICMHVGEVVPYTDWREESLDVAAERIREMTLALGSGP